MTDILNNIITNNLDKNSFSFYYFDNEKIIKLYGKNYIIKYNLTNNSNLPNLVLLSGFSNKSIINSSRVVLIK